jgi:isoquinoline 1-oxidoreductase beta subunit
VKPRRPVTGRTLAPNAFVRVAPDDTVTIVIGKSEMGQGIYTGLAMALAEELDVDPARVTVEFAGADPAFNVPFMPIQFTGGSMSTSTTYTQLREAGARARAMLLAAAAQKWGADATALRTEDGRIFLGDKNASYGSFADAASQLAVPESDAQGPGELPVPGKPHTPRRADGRGSAKFGSTCVYLECCLASSQGQVVARRLRNVNDTRRAPSPSWTSR